MVITIFMPFSLSVLYLTAQFLKIFISEDSSTQMKLRIKAKQKGYLFEARRPRLTKLLPCLIAEQGSHTIGMALWMEFMVWAHGKAVLLTHYF